MNTVNEMLPCAHCGCSAKLCESVETWVQCEGCQTQTRMFNYASTAIETWNTRTQQLDLTAYGQAERARALEEAALLAKEYPEEAWDLSHGVHDTPRGYVVETSDQITAAIRALAQADKGVK